VFLYRNIKSILGRKYRKNFVRFLNISRLVSENIKNDIFYRDKDFFISVYTDIDAQSKLDNDRFDELFRVEWV
jgi:hypothetical protein